MGLLLALTTLAAKAEISNPFEFIEPENKNQLWLNAGMYSYHFAKDHGFNNNNVGFGGEYTFSSIASLTVGGFKNSDSAHTNYTGIYYHPISAGFMKFGFVAGVMNGYPAANDGNYFPALIPTISAEGKWVGANIFVIPSIGDKVHSAISFQLKLKVFD
jgi:hypothetical protein